MKKKYNKPKYPRKKCRYCGYTIGINSYARNHGDKCPYKGAKTGYKFCKKCGKEKQLKEFNKVASCTYDGLNQTCKECASIKNLVCPYCEGLITTKYIDHKITILKV